MYIYKITNKINKKSYIGMTTKSIEKRFKEHQYIAESGGGFYIHNAIRKYGKESFTVSLLGSAKNIEELKKLEIFFIKKFDTYNSGYNLTKGGDFSSNKGKVVVIDSDGIIKQIDIDKFCDSKYKHLNKNKITIFDKNNNSLRVTPEEYKNKYYDLGFRSKNYGYTTVIDENGNRTKIKSEDFNKSKHKGINKGRRTFFDKKTKKFESLEISNQDIDLEIYCSSSRMQYEVHFNGEVTLFNNFGHIPKELGFSQFQYMAHRNKDYEELVITKEVLDKLKPKSRNYDLIGAKLVKVKY